MLNMGFKVQIIIHLKGWATVKFIYKYFYMSVSKY